MRKPAEIVCDRCGAPAVGFNENGDFLCEECMVFEGLYDDAFKDSPEDDSHGDDGQND